MTQAEFIAGLAEIIMAEPDALKPDTELKQFEAWDSTAVINLIVLLDENELEIDEEQIPKCETVKDLMELAGVKAEG